MVQYLSKVSLNFHLHNIKLDDKTISIHTWMIQKDTGSLFQYSTLSKFIYKKTTWKIYVKPSLSTYD